MSKFLQLNQSVLFFFLY